MIEIGVFHNGASDLPTVTTPNGIVVNDGSLEEVHASSQRTVVNQIRQGILADRLGFNYFFMTEHHFQPEGSGRKMAEATLRFFHDEFDLDIAKIMPDIPYPFPKRSIASPNDW